MPIGSKSYGKATCATYRTCLDRTQTSSSSLRTCPTKAAPAGQEAGPEEDKQQDQPAGTDKTRQVRLPTEPDKREKERLPGQKVEQERRGKEVAKGNLPQKWKIRRTIDDIIKGQDFQEMKLENLLN